MTGPSISTSERNAMITRFFVVYIICLLCAILPLIFLFNIPELEITKLDLAKTADPNGKEKDFAERYYKAVAEIDKYVIANKFDERFTYQLLKLMQIKDSLDSTQFYHPAFVKIRELYHSIQEKSENYTDLKKEYDEYKKKMEQQAATPAVPK